MSKRRRKIAEGERQPASVTVTALEDKIDSFRGKFRWLSNFHEQPVEFEGLEFASTENAYQAAKTLDLAGRRAFQMVRPGKAKRMGQKVELREDWDEVKIDIMYQLNKQKFDRCPELAMKLMETRGKLLIEGNTWGDSFWGVNEDGVGRNELGKILMRIRAEL